MGREVSSAPTIKDVAQAAGVSVGTASRVINGNSTVSTAIRLKVQQAIASLKFEPNAAARSMRLKSTRSIGVMMRGITVPILADFVGAIEDILEADGYSLLLACSQDRKERELDILKVFAQRKVDGLIMTTCSELDAELALARTALGIPIVFMDRQVQTASDTIEIAHRSGTRAAVEHLLGLGHRRIGLITGSDALFPGRARVAGYMDAYAKFKLTPDMKYLRADSFSNEAVFSNTMDLVSGDDRATAIISGGFDMLATVMRAVRARDLLIPDDISIIAGADSDLAQLANPAVTSLSWDMAATGRAAARLLLNRLSNQSSEPKRLHIATELLLRKSCAAVQIQKKQRAARS
jgi:LacI family transcriptional regulator